MQGVCQPRHPHGVQKLGTLYLAHPAITLPDWASYTTLTIRRLWQHCICGQCERLSKLFVPANGEYKAELSVWRVPEGGMATQFEGGSTGAVRRNLGLEKPAKPTGWYRYAFRFTLQASAEVELSTEQVERGSSIVGLRISGMTGDAAPTVETDLGNVQCVRAADGWRAYIPAAYNASSGGHGGEHYRERRDHHPQHHRAAQGFWHGGRGAGTGCIGCGKHPVPQCSLKVCTAPARKKCGRVAVNPVESYTTLVDYGQVRVANGQQSSRSNSTSFIPFPASPAVPLQTAWWCWPQSWRHRQHGGHRPWLRDAQLPVRAADSFRLCRAERGKGQAVGVLGEELTMDFKLGSKSVNPWPLFQTSGGLFWKRNS